MAEVTEWEGNCEDRNHLAMVEWRLRVINGFTYQDAWSPTTRAYLDWAQTRKLEVARSFLDRLKYLKSSK